MKTTNIINKKIIDLVQDLEPWNCTKIRLEAAQKLGKLGANSKIVLDALHRCQALENFSDIGRQCKESIDQIYISNKIRRTSGGSKHTKRDKVLYNNIKITSEESNDDLMVSEMVAYSQCNFCEKEVLLTSSSQKYQNLSGENKFYCNFCLRHHLNYRDSKNILLLTFRGIIGYYFYSFYKLAKPHMYLCEIKDYIALHVEAGMQNPLFLYDPETYMWFVDFNRVGKAAKKVPVESVLSTISEILLSFNLYECVIGDVKPHKMYLKYEEAVLKFYHQRHRPENMRILAPTMKSTGAMEYAIDRGYKDPMTGVMSSNKVSYVDKKKIPIEETRNFLPSVLESSLGEKY